MREKNFKQTIPPIKIEDGEEITDEKATNALRRAVHYFAALQSSDGHWPAENAGPMFFVPPIVSYIVVIIVQYCDHHRLVNDMPATELFWCSSPSNC